MSFPKLKSISGSSGSGRGAQAVQVHYTPLPPVYIQQVKNKLSQHPDFKDCTEQELGELALRLTKPQELIKYFSLTIDWELVGSTVAVEATNAPLLETKRPTKNGGKVQDLPVTVILSRMGEQETRPELRVTRRLEMEYGPLHVSLQVGDQILEWNSTSLIVPHGVPITEHQHSSVDNGSIQQLEESRDFERVELVLKDPGKKTQPLTEVAKIIAKYNCYKYYDVISCNCHQFITDTVTAMGYTVPPQLASKLGKYAEKLKAVKNKKTRDVFETHEELDVYVRETIAELSPKDREFLLFQYFQFHIGDKTKARDPKSWRCPVEDCQSERLERQLDTDSLVLNQFIQTEQ